MGLEKGMEGCGERCVKGRRRASGAVRFEPHEGDYKAVKSCNGIVGLLEA